MKNNVSVHHSIICIGLKILPQCSLNKNCGPFSLQCVNKQRKQILYTAVTILKYMKIIIDHVIHSNLFSDGTMSFPTVSTNDFLNTNHNETAFIELRRVFEEYFEIKIQEG